MKKPKKFLYGTTTLTSGNQAEAVINTFTEAVNVHGLIGSIMFATETSSTIIGANWALCCVPEGLATSSDVVISDANFNTSQLQYYIWLSGKCLVHRENLTTCDLRPMTSRSCQPGEQMCLLVRYENAIAGTTPNLRVAVGLQWWETQI